MSLTWTGRRLPNAGEARMEQFLESLKEPKLWTCPIEMKVGRPALEVPPMDAVEGKKGLSGSRAKARVLVRNDELGKLICKHTELFQAKDWRSFVTDLRGWGDLQPNANCLKDHQAHGLLKVLAMTGVPAVLHTKPWSEARIESTLKCGPHQSCKEHLDFLCEELLHFVPKGFWVLPPYQTFKEKMKSQGVLKKLQLAPLGVVPQWERWPRMIAPLNLLWTEQGDLTTCPRRCHAVWMSP